MVLFTIAPECMKDEVEATVGEVIGDLEDLEKHRYCLV